MPYARFTKESWGGCCQDGPKAIDKFQYNDGHLM
jgi:hypothetical protein